MSCLVGRGRRRSEDREIRLAKDELDCMSPMAAIHRQFEQKTKWHRRLSPLKRKPSPCASSASASPQRRPPSPEKRQRRPVPVYQQQPDLMNGAGSFQEAWEHLSRQCAVSGGTQQRRESGGGEQQRLPLVHSLPPSPSKPTPPMPLPLPPPISSASSCCPLEMPDSVNPIGQVVAQPLANGKEKRTMTPMATLAPSSSSETMSSSILASPAWYRDSEGRTGYRPDDFPHGARVQSSPIKVIPAAPRKNGGNESTNNGMPSAIKQQKQQPHQMDGHLQQTQQQHVPRPIRHTSTLPLPSSSSRIQNAAFHGLPPIAPPSIGGGGPFALRRTQNTGELTASERAKREWMVNGGEQQHNGHGNGHGKMMANGGGGRIEQQKEKETGKMGEKEMVAVAEQLMKSSTQSHQKVVKFAETVQITEIAPRDEMESSLCSSNSSSSSSTHSSSSRSNSSSSDEEAPNGNGRGLKTNGGGHQRQMPPAVHPPLAVVRPRQARQKETMGNGGRMMLSNGAGQLNGKAGNERQKKVPLENGKQLAKGAHQHSETVDLERVIEQFFRHCQSLSSLKPEQQQQPDQQSHHQVVQQSPLQQRSVYDNLAEEEGGGDIGRSAIRNGGEGANKEGGGEHWLHTKAKVVAQQNSGPVDWGGARDGSPRRRIEMLVTSRSSSSQRTSGGSSYPAKTLPLSSNGPGSRKASSVEPPLSRIPLMATRPAVRPSNGDSMASTKNGAAHHSGSESASSSSTSSSASFSGRPGPYGRQRLGSMPTTTNAAAIHRPFAVIRNAPPKF